MTEKPEEQLDVGESVAHEEAAPLEVEESASGQPAGGRRLSWPVVVGIVAAILALCAVVVWAATGIATDTGSGDELATFTPAPVPTQAPPGAMIVITEPDQGQVVDIDKPVRVQGKGIGLPEGNVVIQALDWQDNVLTQQPTTLEGQDVGTGGEGSWSIELTIEAEPGTAGVIRAFSPSPQDGSIIAEDSVEVSLGRTPAAESYLKISQPEQEAVLDVTQLVQVSGTGAGLPEGNVVVVAADQGGDVLAEQATTLQGSEVGTGGEGTWSVELAVPASGQTPGYIAAFSASPEQRSLIASDHIEVVFSGELTLERTTWVLDKTIVDGEITAEFADGQVSGSAGCNTYSGTYVSTRAVGKNTIRIGSLAATMMACDAPLMDQEELYLAALESATEYTIEGFTLSIAYPGGVLLFYDQGGPRPRRQ